MIFVFFESYLKCKSNKLRNKRISLWEFLKTWKCLYTLSADELTSIWEHHRQVFIFETWREILGLQNPVQGDFEFLFRFQDMALNTSCSQNPTIFWRKGIKNEKEIECQRCLALILFSHHTSSQCCKARRFDRVAPAISEESERGAAHPHEKNPMNKDKGLELDPIWFSVVWIFSYRDRFYANFPNSEPSPKLLRFFPFALLHFTFLFLCFSRLRTSCFLVTLDTLRLIHKTPTSTPNVTFLQLRRDDAPHLPDSSRKRTSRFKKVGIFFFCCLLENGWGNPVETSCFATLTAGLVRKKY